MAEFEDTHNKDASKHYPSEQSEKQENKTPADTGKEVSDALRPTKTTEGTKQESNTATAPAEPGTSSSDPHNEKKTPTGEDIAEDRIIPRIIEDEMKTSYLDYAMSVIVGRALPDVRDGLKPVHRRILYAMNELGLQANKSFKKSARIVGEVLGKYHPHGDTAVYDTMVRMGQTFALRYPLVKGQGNFGSIDGDNAAAMRYTEAKLQKIAEELLEDLDKETVPFMDNFDGSLKEPAVLPAKAPNLLINGSYGIAVGMATNIPPHNLVEVCNAVIALIDHPDISAADLVENVPGPDFPTGATIVGTAGIRQAYATGKGIITLRATGSVEERKGKQQLVFTEIPYQVNKAQLIEQIAELVKNKKILGIGDLRDESDRDGIRIVVELKKDATPELVQNQLYSFSRLQTNLSMLLLALVDNKPRVLALPNILKAFLGHRQEVVRKRIAYDLAKAKERFHLLEGLLIALNHVDEVITLIKKAKSAQEAKQGLMNEYDLSEKQSQAILDMRLQRLAVLEQEKIRTEYQEVRKKIQELQSILASEERILDIIKKELQELIQKYGDERKTRIIETDDTVEIEDLIKKEQVVVTITRSGYAKRMPLHTYKVQNKGGKGIIGADTKADDQIDQLFVAHSHASILVFTDQGRVHWIKTYQIPEAKRQSMGKSFANLVDLKPGEKINTVIPIKTFDDHHLVMCTRAGFVKKTDLRAFSRPRKGGIIAIGLDPDDVLVNVLRTDGTKNILLATRQGRAIKFSETEVRSMGRSARGVRGVRLQKDDAVVGAVIAEDQKNLLTITENGYGKRTTLKDYRLIGRGGKGVINIRCTPRNGKVAAIKSVNEKDELMFISRKGIIIRTTSSSISCIGRNTQGVRLMRLNPEDRVVAAAKIVKKEETPEA